MPTEDDEAIAVRIESAIAELNDALAHSNNNGLDVGIGYGDRASSYIIRVSNGSTRFNVDSIIRMETTEVRGRAPLGGGRP